MAFYCIDDALDLSEAGTISEIQLLIVDFTKSEDVWLSCYFGVIANISLQWGAFAPLFFRC